MKQFPDQFLQSLTGIPGFDPGAFNQVHASGTQVTSIRTNPIKWRSEKPLHTSGEEKRDLSANFDGPVPWSRYGWYLSRRPSFTFDPLFHAGCYYVQEASSMFLEQALVQLLDLSQSIRVLDLCAAPGGKSTHLQSLISPESLLVSNEVIRARSHVLVDNIVKWGAPNVVVSNNDPSVFQKLPAFFDLMVVDAPCSGSGLFRRDEDAMDEWSLNNVQLCSQRQQRILADALPALRENGLLVYSTCSYSREEDEDINDWLVGAMDMEPISLDLHPEWGIVETHSKKTGAPGYRFFPDKLKGEGFYLACFRKRSAPASSSPRPARFEKASSKERSILQPWIKGEDVEWIRERDSWFALPASFSNEVQVLASVLNVQYRGVELGAIMKERLVPAHALALSNWLPESIAANELEYDDAIRYLQRQEMQKEFSGKGWQLVRYQNHNLGWVNVLPNRVNNYYPKELRILKQRNDSAFEK